MSGCIPSHTAPSHTAKLLDGKCIFKNAFYSVPLHKDYQKYLKFRWLEKMFKFLGMPNGYFEAMHILMKILKPPFQFCKNKGCS